MKLLLLFLVFSSLIFSRCERQIEHSKLSQPTSEIKCNEKGCDGFYIGREFVDGEDIAHQFSNKMAHVVGDKLKQLYAIKQYSSVSMGNIRMSTKGMGTGRVTYKLHIPFHRVQEKCDAHTSFDHSGGWNHVPALSERKRQLEKALLEGEKLTISSLRTTPEGLQEYWIQWKNNKVQAECIK